MFVKPNFVNPANNSLDSGQRKDRFIYAGRLDKLKGIKILFQAWKLFGKNAPELIVCGNGDMKEWCKEYIIENNLTSIKLMGFVPNVEVKRLIANSKALILPTQWYEGFPVSIIEAFSAGTPVICSDFGNTGNLVTEGITGCKFQHDSPDKLVQAVKKLKSDKNIYRTTSDEYKRRYTENQNYEMLIEIYKVLL